MVGYGNEEFVYTEMFLRARDFATPLGTVGSDPIWMVSCKMSLRSRDFPFLGKIVDLIIFLERSSITLK
jgi:hypothetical protein